MSKHPREPRSDGHDVVAALALAIRDHQGVARGELPRMITLSEPAWSLIKRTLPDGKWRDANGAPSQILGVPAKLADQKADFLLLAR